MAEKIADKTAAERAADSRDDAAASRLTSHKKTPAANAGNPAAAGDEITTVTRRKRQYLIGIRSWAHTYGTPGFAPLPVDSVLEQLRTMGEVEIVRRIRARGFQPLASDASGAQDIIVVRMDEQRGEALRLSAPPYLVVEEDAPLSGAQALIPAALGQPLAEPVSPFTGRHRELRFRVLGEDQQPLARAGVYVYGPGFPVQAITDGSGHASVPLFVVDGDDSIRAIYVKPAADHWERFIPNPSIDTGEVNVIQLKALNRGGARYPGERILGWGQRLMKLDRLSGEHTGAGVKLGIIDSGCDASHPQLGHITRGADLSRGNEVREDGTRQENAGNWKSDELGQGTHAAGIIAANGHAAHQKEVKTQAAAGIAGFAPAAEVHVFKLLPGGHFSDLIEALDQSIERQLDLLHLGVCSAHGSELVAQKLNEARARGVACIAASGSNGGATQFPGTVPGVLTVAALGKLNEFPPDTWHAQTALPQRVAFTGLFATYFSCAGPQVAVSAPGVAVVSCAVGGGYAAHDGTAAAAAHVAGFAAVLLERHPLFRNPFGAHGESRVAALFELIRASAVPYVQIDPMRVGAGLPDLQQVPAGLPAAAGFEPASALQIQLRAAGLMF